ncbi:MAG: hypothetical protein AAGF19_05315 [Pseudomonadota bacterium]
MSVVLTNQKGESVRDAVITFTPAAGGAGDEAATGEEGERASDAPYAINQKNIAFDPFVSLVPVGSTVTFKNEDSVLHHVFSFSKAKRFNLKLFGASESQDVVFDQGGIVSVGCNIHDGMIAYVFVATAPYAAQTGEAATTVLADLPLGDGVLTIWHPLLRAKGNQISQDITVTDAMAPIEVSAKFRRAVHISGDY